MNKYMRVGIVAALLSVPPAAWAAQKPVSIADVATATFTIDAIDHTTRIVTLKDKDGISHDVLCGPDVKRFDALKVGDKVTFRYHESLVSAIRKPGSAPAAAATSGVTRSEGTKPGGSISQQMSATVTIEAIDANVPSVTVKGPDGRRLSFKVEDKKNLEGYKAGDKVEITYTQALAVSVEPAGK
jgi:Cu/Ag efflux protein CusF